MKTKKFKTDFDPPPEGYSLVFIGTRQEGDLYWGVNINEWTKCSGSITHDVDYYDYPTARKIEPDMSGISVPEGYELINEGIIQEDYLTSVSGRAWSKTRLAGKDISTDGAAMYVRPIPITSKANKNYSDWGEW